MKVWVWPEDCEILITGYLFEEQFWKFDDCTYIEKTNPKSLGWIYIGEL